MQQPKQSQTRVMNLDDNDKEEILYDALPPPRKASKGPIVAGVILILIVAVLLSSIAIILEDVYSQVSTQ